MLFAKNKERNEEKYIHYTMRKADKRSNSSNSRSEKIEPSPRKKSIPKKIKSKELPFEKRKKDEKHRRSLSQAGILGKAMSLYNMQKNNHSPSDQFPLKVSCKEVGTRFGYLLQDGGRVDLD